MCILRGCSVSDSFVIVISDQIALRRPVFAPPVLTLQTVTEVLQDEYVLLLNNFSHLNGIAL